MVTNESCLICSVVGSPTHIQVSWRPSIGRPWLTLCEDCAQRLRNNLSALPANPVKPDVMPLLPSSGKINIF